MRTLTANKIKAKFKSLNPRKEKWAVRIYLLNTGLPIVSRVQSSVRLVMPGSDGSKAEMPTPNILALPSHLGMMKIWKFLNIFFSKNLRGPMFAQSGQGGLFGQMSSKPRSSGDRSPKYSNSSFPVDLGGGGLLGSLSRYKIIQEKFRQCWIFKDYLSPTTIITKELKVSV